MNAANLHSITLAQGFFAAGGSCGIKASGKPDLALIVSDRPCAAAGAFTRSRTPAPPIAVNRRHLRSGRARAIVVNSGNANASTGKAGRADASAMCRRAAQAVSRAAGGGGSGGSIDAEEVLVASTGIIGRPLPMDRIEKGIDALAGQLARGVDADAAAARAIMTTDLVPKIAGMTLTLDHRTIHIGGVAKGSGMIAPNMGTLLAFVTTDAAISPTALRVAVQKAAAASFNRISVDQHTSPSDTLLVLANGAAGNASISDAGPALDLFTEALTEVCRELAYQIVKDGEGATKVFRARITGARTEKEADKVAKAVIDSPLVKTAVHGGDPNWGRVVTAAGYSGAAVQPGKMSLTIGKSEGASDLPLPLLRGRLGGGRKRGNLPSPNPSLRREGGISEPSVVQNPSSGVQSPKFEVAEVGSDGGVCVFAEGMPKTLNEQEARRLGAIMKASDITFTLDLGRGDAAVEWLGCDLSREYITINADYTT